jgi:hypothetical protein
MCVALGYRLNAFLSAFGRLGALTNTERVMPSGKAKVTRKTCSLVLAMFSSNQNIKRFFRDSRTKTQINHNPQVIKVMKQSPTNFQNPYRFG